MNRKQLSNIVLVVGVVIVVVALLGDVIGLGRPPIGPRQQMAVGAGVLVVILGWYLRRGK